MKPTKSNILKLAFFALGVLILNSCMGDDKSNWELYKDWREFNDNWLIEQTVRTNPDGTAYYQRCVMPTDPQAYVLMHNIGEVHTDSLKPLYTSATKVNYTLRLANDSIVDQGTNFRSQLNSTSLIAGWGISIMQLHVGDSARFVVPYAIGYGATGAGENIPPYSNLVFDIKLLDITAYEIRP